jgi:hypothetical protein
MKASRISIVSTFVLLFILAVSSDLYACIQDNTPPDLISLDAVPKSINVYDGQQTVTFTLQIADDLSGFNSGSLVLSSPSGDQSITADISGDAQTPAGSGIYKITITFPQSSEIGLWRISSMSLKDNANNIGHPDLGTLEGIQVFSVALDTTPPDVERLEVVTHVINVYDGQKEAILVLHITDDLSGFTSGSLSLTSPSGNQTASGSIDAGQLLTGDKNDGIYKLTVPFPQFSETGTWHIASLQVKDAANNTGNPDVSGYEGIEVYSMQDCYALNASVIGDKGTVSPTSGIYAKGRVVALLATPDAGYHVKAWVGTADDTSTEQKNSVIMDSDRIVTVEFDQTSDSEEDNNNNHNNNGGGSSCFILAAQPDTSNPQQVLLLVCFFMLLICIPHSIRLFMRR